MKNNTPEFKFETIPPIPLPSFRISTKATILQFLYGHPTIPAGSHFEIIDEFDPQDQWVPVSISMYNREEEKVFLVDISNVPMGFHTREEWKQEDEAGEDLSDIIMLPVEWWINNLLTIKEQNDMLGLEVLKLGDIARTGMLMRPFSKIDSDLLPLDLVETAKEICISEGLGLRECVQYLVSERGCGYFSIGYMNGIILVTDTNLVVTQSVDTNQSKLYELWYLTNSDMEHECSFNSLDAAKEYIIREYKR